MSDRGKHFTGVKGLGVTPYPPTYTWTLSRPPRATPEDKKNTFTAVSASTKEMMDEVHAFSEGVVTLRKTLIQ